MNTKIIAFGDSFINTFSSLSNQNFKIKKFKGATMKGIINKSENYKEILKILEKTEYDYGIFGLGQVDFFFYYYHKKYIDKDLDILSKIYKNAKVYVSIIANLENIKKKIILGILPSHITNENYRRFLVGYGIFTNENINLITDIDIDYIGRNSRIIHYNKLLRKHCKKNNVYFCNAYKYIINANGYVNEIILLKHNEINIHVNYEILLLVYLTKCLKFLLQYYDINNIIDIAEKNFNEYMKEKKLGPAFDFDRPKILLFLESIK